LASLETSKGEQGQIEENKGGAGGYNWQSPEKISKCDLGERYTREYKGGRGKERHREHKHRLGERKFRSKLEN